jgi:DNA-directed RNA polymerase specialized sigma24 family protein
VLPDETKADSFTEFVTETETRLRHALTASFGPERGREAAAEALAYGWEHWDRIGVMTNPAGYLYRVGRDRARRMYRRRRVLLPGVAVGRDPWVEPGLPVALAQLPEQQRLVVALLHGYQWSLGEVAELLDVSKGTVQSYADRALKRLRRKMGVEL